eukprot:CAMPEP_0168468506 /NCGR_PEP_ID=MMETSP0228-20121227/57741_1 /TAXON_ID=133427 /ORGANISM="Protoceratium reticulatum, Strain CCCM 535 (=CCMP 1889)" /LENGTH=190 /DNA_ID=CAMNT_0008484265 /DNA_START=13 /DNA_END=583 /DNA_ORIENTATION=-
MAFHTSSRAQPPDFPEDLLGPGHVQVPPAEAGGTDSRGPPLVQHAVWAERGSPSSLPAARMGGLPAGGLHHPPDLPERGLSLEYDRRFTPVLDRGTPLERARSLFEGRCHEYEASEANTSMYGWDMPKSLVLEEQDEDRGPTPPGIYDGAGPGPAESSFGGLRQRLQMPPEGDSAYKGFGDPGRRSWQRD